MNAQFVDEQSHPPYEVQEILVCGKECLKTLSHQDGTFVSTCNKFTVSFLTTPEDWLIWSSSE